MTKPKDVIKHPLLITTDHLEKIFPNGRMAILKWTPKKPKELIVEWASSEHFEKYPNFREKGKICH